MECVFGLIALLGVFFIAMGLLYLKRPDIQWAIQKWHLELFGSIKAEQGADWGCWSRVGAFVLIGMGLYTLVMVASGYSQVQNIDATRDAAMTVLAHSRENDAATATNVARQPDVRTLQAVFAPLIPTLQAQARDIPGANLRLSDSRRRRYSLEDYPVYFGICEQSNEFYIIVEHWGVARATYRYGYLVGGASRRNCGTYRAYSSPYGWTQLADPADGAADLQSPSVTATPAR